jgi:hypothetical protein
LKNKIEKILTLIEAYCKKKLVSTYQFLHFGIAIEINANSTHCQVLRTKTFQCSLFLPSLKIALKVYAILILLIFSLNIYASDFYISTTELNIRSGAGKNYKTLTVLEKGDTVKILENNDDYWVKVQYQDKIGYAAKQYLQPIEIIEKIETVKIPRNRRR